MAAGRGPEFNGTVTARFFLAGEPVLTAEEIKALLENREEIREVRVNEKEGTLLFRWTGMYKALSGLEAACSNDGLCLRVLSPMRLQLQLNPRNRGTFKSAEMEEALRKAGCQRVTGFGSGSYEVWTPRMVSNLRFLDTLREAVDPLNVDVKLRSHDVLTYEGEFGPRMAEVKATLRSVKGALICETASGRIRILARRNDLKEKELRAAFDALGIALKRVDG